MITSFNPEDVDLLQGQGLLPPTTAAAPPPQSSMTTGQMAEALGAGNPAAQPLETRSLVAGNPQAPAPAEVPMPGPQKRSLVSRVLGAAPWTAPFVAAQDIPAQQAMYRQMQNLEMQNTRSLIASRNVETASLAHMREAQALRESYLPFQNPQTGQYGVIDLRQVGNSDYKPPIYSFTGDMRKDTASFLEFTRSVLPPEVLNRPEVQLELAAAGRLASMGRIKEMLDKVSALGGQLRSETAQRMNSDVGRFTSDWLATNRLPDTPENWLKAHAAYTKETKIQPAMVRVEGFGDIRGPGALYDTKTKQSTFLSWNDYNRAEREEPGRYVPASLSPEAQMNVRTWKDLAPNGTTGRQLTSYDAFIQHAGQLYDAVGSLKNTSSPLMNKPMNWLRAHAAGDPKISEFLAKLDPVQKEFETFLLGGHALYAEDRKSAEQILDVNASPAQMYAVLPSLVHTGSARLSALNDTFHRATGEDIPNLVSPEAQNAIDLIEGRKGTSKGRAALGGTVSYREGDAVYDIPADKANDFEKKHPGAKRTLQ